MRGGGEAVVRRGHRVSEFRENITFHDNLEGLIIDASTTHLQEGKEGRGGKSISLCQG